MSACLATDSITPKHSASTIIAKCNVMPVITTHTFSATEVSCELTSWSVGNGSSLFVSLCIPTLDFTGDGTTVTCSAIATLVAPQAVVDVPCVVVVGATTQTGMITLNTNKTIVIASTPAAGTFTGATACKVYPTVITYSSY